MNTIHDFLSAPADAHIWVPFFAALLFGLYSENKVMGRILAVALLGVLAASVWTWQVKNGHPGWLSPAAGDEYTTMLIMAVGAIIIGKMLLETSKAFKRNLSRSS